MADNSIPWFRELFDEVNEYHGYVLYYDVLVPWIEKARAAMAECARFKSPSIYVPGDEAAQSG